MIPASGAAEPPFPAVAGFDGQVGGASAACGRPFTAAGVALSFGLGSLLTTLVEGARLAYSAESILLAIASASLIGVVFGFMPARSAARLDPGEALARESGTSSPLPSWERVVFPRSTENRVRGLRYPMLRC